MNIWHQFLTLSLLLGLFQVACRPAAHSTLQRSETKQAVSKVAVGFIGQSNCQGMGDSALSPVPAQGVAYEWLFTQRGSAEGTGQLVSLRDPMSRNKLATTFRSRTGSKIPAFAIRYYVLTGSQAYVSHYGVSGTSVFQQPNSTSNMNWGPTGILRAAFALQTRHMLNHPEVPDQLSWVDLTIGETDGYWLEQYPEVFAAFPHQMVVPGVFDAAHGFPEGYQNPERKRDAYTAYKELIAYLQAQFPGVKININQTGRWQRTADGYPQSGASLKHYNGVQRMWAVQEHLGRTLPDVYCEMTEAKDFPFMGTAPFEFLKPDGVHYTQKGLDYMGVRDADIMASH